VTRGEALFNGEDLLTMRPARRRAVRGNEMAMIFQDPMTSLNPVATIGAQLVEAVRVHGRASKAVARRRALEVMKAVGIPSPERRIDDYPHRFSGGMRQRVMIAMALINDPDVLIADEPTTALDVTTQAQILKLLKRLQAERDSAVILVTHDLGVVAETADRVLVMYGGRIAEDAGVQELFEHPRHPYTWGLLGSRPRIDQDVARLVQIPGAPPSLLSPPSGCRFHPRCPYAFERCVREAPMLIASSGSGHAEACHLSDDVKQRGPVAFAERAAELGS
jgi:oligopeptide/dipeptide ABC transporter ATP-binding protein